MYSIEKERRRDQGCGNGRRRGTADAEIDENMKK